MEWWEKGKYPLQIGKSNFLRIVDFYLFNCPVYNKVQISRVSVMGKTFEERHITGKRLTTLLKDMRNMVETFKLVDGKEDIENVLEAETKKLKYKSDAFQIVCFIENSDLGQTKTIFYSIRNALAHGAFSVKSIKKEKYYYFENRNRGKVKAQLKIKESTLLEWIKLVEKYTI